MISKCEELITRLVINAPITDEDAQILFSAMELYCKKNPTIKLCEFVETVSEKLCHGILWTTMYRVVIRDLY